jgi:hypothetical protein
MSDPTARALADQATDTALRAKGAMVLAPRWVR